MSRNADAHPVHDRGGCKEHDPAYNAEAAGSNGCARCTALLMDQRDDLLVALESAVAYLKPRVAGGVTGAALLPTLVSAIAKAKGEQA